MKFPLSPLFAACALTMAVSSAYAADAMPAMAPAEGAAAEAKALILLKPDDAEFKPVPGAAPCNTMANLRGDLSKGPATFTSKLTPGCIAPWHWHTPTEEVIVLKGTAVMQMKGEAAITLPTGSYSQLPSKHWHRFRCTKDGDCIVLVIADGLFDIHFVDKNGKEISAEKAQRLAEKEGTKGW